ncbi:MAG: hypothetical protein GXO73_00525 [Calditrichaeota bacterium]|nr:hypothetical protein [Calditrichota bacterium]
MQRQRRSTVHHPKREEPEIDRVRYERQIRFAELGERGQQVLAKARVTIVGAGGLGSHVATTLARMGVGTLKVIDRDLVELGNLHRQACYTEEDVQQAMPKVYALRRHLLAANSSVKIEPVLAHVDPYNVLDLLRGSDIVVDGTDSLGARFLLNEAAVELSVPFVHGAIAGSSGLVLGVEPGATACLFCAFGEEETKPQPRGIGSAAGIFPPSVEVVAALQSALAVRRVVAGPEDWGGKLFAIDSWTGDLDTSEIRRRTGREACQVCVRHRYQWLGGEKPEGPRVDVDEDQINVIPEKPRPVDFDVIAARLYRANEIKRNDYLVWARLGDLQLVVFQDGRLAVKGTNDWAEAVHLYEKYLGE